MIRDPRLDFVYIATQLKVLESSELAMSAARRLANARETPFHQANPTNLASSILSSIEIRRVENTQMIDILATRQDAYEAQAIANAVAEAYMNDAHERRMDASLASLRWLRNQATEYKSRRDASALALQQFRERELADAFVDRRNMVSERLQSMNAELNALMAARLLMETEIQTLDELGNQNDWLVAPHIAEDPTVKQLTARIAEQETKIILLLARYRRKHPEVINANRELEEIKRQRQERSVVAAQGLRDQYALRIEQENALRQSISQLQQASFDLDRKLLAFGELQRNLDIEDGLYQSVLERMKSVSVRGDVPIQDVLIRDPAHLPSYPFNIAGSDSLYRGAFLGAFVGFGLACFLHLLDGRIRRADEIERLLGLTVLSVIPKIRGLRAADRYQVTRLKPESSSGEAFRTLRASIRLHPADGKRLMVSSALASTGKSLAATNLAIVFAQDGERTLLVDADMRRPALQKHLDTPKGGARSEVGLTDILRGTRRWSDVVVKSNIENLDLLSVGAVPNNPSELLGSRFMKEFLSEASDRYDRIILDCPPVLGVSDPLVLLPLVSGILFVIRFNDTQRRYALQAIRKLSQTDTPILGCILNGMDAGRIHYYYGYHYANEYHGKNRSRHRRPANALGSMPNLVDSLPGLTIATGKSDFPPDTTKAREPDA